MFLSTAVGLPLDLSVVINPEPRHFRHAQDIFDRLQSHTAPDIFRPKALYDGQAILFSSHVLNLAGGGSGNVSIHVIVTFIATYLFTPVQCGHVR